MKLIGVIRVSRDSQAGEGKKDLDRQRQAIRIIQEETGASLVGGAPVEVIGVSGSDLADTPEWANTIAPAILSGAHVACDNVDRMIRADAFDLRTLGHLQAAEGRLYLPGKVYDTTDHRDVFMLTVYAGMGGYEKREIARRSKAGKEAKRKRGQWVMSSDKLPMGCTYDRNAPEGKWWGYDEDQAEKVRMAYFLYGVEGWTLNKIAKYLRVSPYGPKVILRNPIYKGMLTFSHAAKMLKGGKTQNYAREPQDVIRVRVYGDEDKGQPPQLVTDELWETVVRRIDENAASRRKLREETRPDIWLSGYVIVDENLEGVTDLDMDAPPSRHVIYGHTRGQKPSRYACRCQHRQEERCDFASMNADNLNSTMDDYLSELTKDPHVIAEFKRQVDEYKTNGGGAAIAALEAKINKLKSKLERLDDLYVDGEITRARRDEKATKIKTDLVNAERALAQVENRPQPTMRDVDMLAKEWVWDRDWDHTRKREWLQKYVSVIKVSRDHVEELTIRIPSETGGLPCVPVHERRTEIIRKRRPDRRTLAKSTATATATDA